mmetsp:Transcript_56801/g.182516  ORF Transcript_56801/g.182516 Transcript_56801/m.182516 type:complete len:249 (+) Transcript_56801:109-855(+)
MTSSAVFPSGSSVPPAAAAPGSGRLPVLAVRGRVASCSALGPSVSTRRSSSSVMPPEPSRSKMLKATWSWSLRPSLARSRQPAMNSEYSTLPLWSLSRDSMMSSWSSLAATPTSWRTCRASTWLRRPSPELSYFLNLRLRWCSCERFSCEVMHAMAIFMRWDCRCWLCSAVLSAGVGSTFWCASLALVSHVSLAASAAEGRMPSSLDSSCWQSQRAPRPHLNFDSSSHGGCRRGLHTAWACMSRLSAL